MNNTNIVSHFLIGTPGSGKSTFASDLAKQGDYAIVSTDNIRISLYGDYKIQGVWSQVESEAISQICVALNSGKGVIYDATNCKRCFRMDFLEKVRQYYSDCTWIAWYLNTPLETCYAWNQERRRQVPQDIIKAMHESVRQFPPLAAEGFGCVEEINVSSTEFSPKLISYKIKTLHQSIVNSNNRTLHDNIVLHCYSNLLDFDRLMHLISLIIEKPGIGSLQADINTIAEIAATMATSRGHIYADEKAIEKDLQWLEENGIITCDYKSLEKEKPNIESLVTSAHSYSDIEPFKRLIGIIRFIVHNPFLPNNGSGHLLSLLKALQQEGIIYGDCSDSIRKDFEKILKPYKILPKFTMRHGYFAGTGILSQQELIKVFEILQSQADSLDDPIALEFYQTFKQRMLQTKLIEADKNIYPVRAIANHSIVDEQYLHETALLKKIPYLEQAILKGELLELNRFASGGKYDGDAKSYILAYPLQLVFHNLAWYLGFECVQGEEPGLLRFERLDRLFLGNFQNQYRSRQEQEKSLHKLQKLLKGSAGIFLGTSVVDQKKFLSHNKKERAKVCETIELWFNDTTYRFIVEGTKRFPHIKMSRPTFPGKANLPESIFCWNETTGDKNFPNRFQVVLAKWSIYDFDLWRWIVGFGGTVRVITPPELVEKINNIGKGIVEAYEQY
jgi:predicted kinase